MVQTLTNHFITLAIHIVMLEVSIRIGIVASLEIPVSHAAIFRLPLVVQQIRKREVIVNSVGVINFHTLKLVMTTPYNPSKVSPCLNCTHDVLETISANSRICFGAKGQPTFKNISRVRGA